MTGGQIVQCLAQFSKNCERLVHPMKAFKPLDVGASIACLLCLPT